MSIIANVTIQRGGTVAQGGSTIAYNGAALNVPVQIDNLSVEMGTYVVGTTRGATPFDAYSIYVFRALSPTIIQRQDELIDSKNLDPLNNNQPTRYRVVGNPNYFSEDGHMELKAIRIYGK